MSDIHQSATIQKSITDEINKADGRDPEWRNDTEPCPFCGSHAHLGGENEDLVKLLD